MPLYPLKFAPRLVPKIWGGRRLAEVLNKTLPPDILIGESWEIYDFPPGVVEKSTDWVSARITNGPLAGRSLHDVIVEHGRELYGDATLTGPLGQFPLLIKFLDAREDLSVQVHPDAAYAAENAHCHLKTEAWYVLQHEPDAAIYKGLTPGTTPEILRAGIEDGTVMDLIVRLPVEVGQCHFLPSGTVHALGAGVLVAEVQTPSDTTFRVYDFDRVEASTGKPRALHVEQAMACIDFSDGGGAIQPPEASSSDTPFNRALVDSPYFVIERVHAGRGTEQRLPQGEMSVWIFLEGNASLRADDVDETIPVTKGETILLPAGMKNPTLRTATDCQWLIVRLPPSADGGIEAGIH